MAWSAFLWALLSLLLATGKPAASKPGLWLESGPVHTRPEGVAGGTWGQEARMEAVSAVAHLVMRSAHCQLHRSDSAPCFASDDRLHALREFGQKDAAWERLLASHSLHELARRFWREIDYERGLFFVQHALAHKLFPYRDPGLLRRWQQGLSWPGPGFRRPKLELADVLVLKAQCMLELGRHGEHSLELLAQAGEAIRLAAALMNNARAFPPAVRRHLEQLTGYLAMSAADTLQRIKLGRLTDVTGQYGLSCPGCADKWDWVELLIDHLELPLTVSRSSHTTRHSAGSATPTARLLALSFDSTALQPSGSDPPSSHMQALFARLMATVHSRFVAQLTPACRHLDPSTGGCMSYVPAWVSDTALEAAWQRGRLWGGSGAGNPAGTPLHGTTGASATGGEAQGQADAAPLPPPPEAVTLLYSPWMQRLAAREQQPHLGVNHKATADPWATQTRAPGATPPAKPGDTGGHTGDEVQRSAVPYSVQYGKVHGMSGELRDFSAWSGVGEDMMLQAGGDGGYGESSGGVFANLNSLVTRWAVDGLTTDMKQLLASLEVLAGVSWASAALVGAGGDATGAAPQHSSAPEAAVSPGSQKAVADGVPHEAGSPPSAGEGMEGDSAGAASLDTVVEVWNSPALQRAESHYMTVLERCMAGSPGSPSLHPAACVAALEALAHAPAGNARGARRCQPSDTGPGCSSDPTASDVLDYDTPASFADFLGQFSFESEARHAVDRQLKEQLELLAGEQHAGTDEPLGVLLLVGTSLGLAVLCSTGKTRRRLLRLLTGRALWSAVAPARPERVTWSGAVTSATTQEGPSAVQQASARSTAAAHAPSSKRLRQRERPKDTPRATAPLARTTAPPPQPAPPQAQQPASQPKQQSVPGGSARPAQSEPAVSRKDTGGSWWGTLCSLARSVSMSSTVSSDTPACHVSTPAGLQPSGPDSTWHLQGCGGAQGTCSDSVSSYAAAPDAADWHKSEARGGGGSPDSRQGGEGLSGVQAAAHADSLEHTHEQLSALRRGWPDETADEGWQQHFSKPRRSRAGAKQRPLGVTSPNTSGSTASNPAVTGKRAGALARKSPAPVTAPVSSAAHAPAPRTQPALPAAEVEERGAGARRHSGSWLDWMAGSRKPAGHTTPSTDAPAPANAHGASPQAPPPPPPQLGQPCGRKAAAPRASQPPPVHASLSDLTVLQTASPIRTSAVSKEARLSARSSAGDGEVGGAHTAPPAMPAAPVNKPVDKLSACASTLGTSPTSGASRLIGTLTAWMGMSPASPTPATAAAAAMPLVQSYSSVTASTTHSNASSPLPPHERSALRGGVMPALAAVGGTPHVPGVPGAAPDTATSSAGSPVQAAIAHKGGELSALAGRSALAGGGSSAGSVHTPTPTSAASSASRPLNPDAPAFSLPRPAKFACEPPASLPLPRANVAAGGPHPLLSGLGHSVVTDTLTGLHQRAPGAAGAMMAAAAVATQRLRNDPFTQPLPGRKATSARLSGLTAAAVGQPCGAPPPAAYLTAAPLSASPLATFQSVPSAVEERALAAASGLETQASTASSSSAHHRSLPDDLLTAWPSDVGGCAGGEHAEAPPAPAAAPHATTSLAPGLGGGLQGLSVFAGSSVWSPAAAGGSSTQVLGGWHAGTGHASNDAVWGAGSFTRVSTNTFTAAPGRLSALDAGLGMGAHSWQLGGAGAGMGGSAGALPDDLQWHGGEGEELQDSHLAHDILRHVVE